MISRGQEPAHWEDIGGVSARMLQSLTHEIESRLGGGSTHAAAETAGSAETTDENPERDRYAPLADHLTENYPDSDATLALEEVERLLGFELPPKAWVDPTWWTENPNLAYRRHIATWLDLGWEAYPSLASQRVSFRRIPGWVPTEVVDEPAAEETAAEQVAAPEPESTEDAATPEPMAASDEGSPVDEAPTADPTPAPEEHAVSGLKVAPLDGIRRVGDPEQTDNDTPSDAGSADPATDGSASEDDSATLEANAPSETPRPEAETESTETTAPEPAGEAPAGKAPESAEESTPAPAPAAPEGGTRWKIGRFTRSLFLSEKNEHPIDCGEYTPHVCAAFAAGLGTGVLERAVSLFDALQNGGEIDSPDLAELLDCKTSGLGGRLATPLRRRATVLEIEPPYVIEVDDEEGRRTWRAAAGADAYLAGALRDELARRNPADAS